MNCRFLLTISLMTLICVDPAIAQVTLEQQNAYKKYLTESAQVGEENAVDKYATPEVYENSGDGLVNPAEQSGLGGSPDAGNVVGSDQRGLKAFGYDLFGGSSESFSPIMESSPPPDYKLGPGDHVMVNVWGRVDMQLELTIDREGKVFIPKVGEIVAWGMTMDEFKKRLNSAMSSAYSDYKLSVSLGKIRRIKVFVYGEVKKPGGYTLSSLATLFSALNVAGGASENGSLRTIKHIRHNNILSEIDLYRFLLTGDNSQDAELQSGDVIFVPVIGPRVAIRGEIKRPAVYELKGGEKLMDLFELAGGSTAESFMQKVDVDRIGVDDNRILLTVDISSSAPDDDNNLPLADGDRINVPSIFDSLNNTVVLSGHIKHPGRYELTEDMRVSDLLNCGELLIEDSYLERANLFRTKSDLTREVYSINLEAIFSGDESTDFLLMDNDSIAIYSQKQMRRDMSVSIYGAVKNPGAYEYFKDMRLSDLVFLAGNPMKQAYLLRAEIARVNPGKPADLIFANLDKAVENKGQADDILLSEDDIVYIRSIPGWRVGESVTIEGEVAFPGSYPLIKENESLLDLLERCGGTTDEAFMEGLVFLRRSIEEDIARRQVKSILASTEPTVLDSLNRPIPKLNTGVDYGQLSRIVIDVERLGKNPRSPDNIILRNGDYVYVPPKPSGIQVMGAVASSGTITYKNGKRPPYFVSRAGGYTANAAKNQIRLVKADGRIFAGGEAIREKVDIGDVVIVPFKMKKDKEWLRTGVSIAGILTSVATTIFIVDRLN